MSTIADLWKAYLTGEGYTFSSVQGTIKEALLAETGRSTGATQELWKAYLEAEGYDGAVPDMMKKWLAAKGYDGSVQDMLKKALRAGDIFAAFSPEDLFASGEFGDWFDFRETTGLWVDETASLTPVTTDGDLVGAAVGRRGNVTIIQATTTAKPIWKTTEIQADSSNQKTLTGEFTTMPNTAPHAIYVAGRLVVSNATNANGAIARLLNGTTTKSQAIIRRQESVITIFDSSSTDTTSDLGLVDQYAYLAGIRPGTTSYRQSNHISRTAGTFAEAATTALDNFAILCNRTTGNYGATKGAVFINRDLTESEVAQLNEYFGVA